jgi:hypothetical protein
MGKLPPPFLVEMKFSSEHRCEEGGGIDLDEWKK